MQSVALFTGFAALITLIALIALIAQVCMVFYATADVDIDGDTAWRTLFGV